MKMNETKATPESGVSEEDRKRIDSYIRSHPDGGDFELYVRLKDIAEKVTEYERRDKAVLRAAYDELEKQWRDINRKQAELVEENTKMKQFIENFIEHTSSGYDGDALIWALRTEAALTKTPKP